MEQFQCASLCSKLPWDDVQPAKQSDLHSSTGAQPQTSVLEVSDKTFLKQFFLVL